MDRLDTLVRELRASAGADTDAPNPRPPKPATRPRWRRPLFIVLGIIAGLVLVAAVLPDDQTAGEAHPAAPQHTQRAVEAPLDMHATPSPLQWAAVVEHLDHMRGLAFMRGRIAELLLADYSPSPAFSADESMLYALMEVHAHAASFPLRVKAVREEYVTVGEKIPRAMLTVTDEMGAYDIVDANGKVLRHVPARGARTWHVELQRSTLAGWVYVSAVSAASR